LRVSSFSADAGIGHDTMTATQQFDPAGLYSPLY
jgi:hypothetical protein